METGRVLERHRTKREETAMQTIGQALREAQLAFVVGTVTLVAGALCAGPALGFDRDCESTGSWHVCTWELLGQTVSAEATVRRVHKGRRGAKMAFQCSESSIGGKRFRHRHVTLQWGPTPASHVARGPLDTKVSIDGRPPETLRWTATEYEQNEDYETLVDVSHRANAGEWTDDALWERLKKASSVEIQFGEARPQWAGLWTRFPMDGSNAALTRVQEACPME